MSVLKEITVQLRPHQTVAVNLFFCRGGKRPWHYSTDQSFFCIQDMVRFQYQEQQQTNHPAAAAETMK
jgi:hypothetical protein